jgi:Protein of unknown function (DUF3298)
MDDDPTNNEGNNLAVLCLDCHRDTQIRGGFDRKLDAAQIALYKKDWLVRVLANREREQVPNRAVWNSAKGARVLKYLQVREDSDVHSYSFEADYPEVATGDSFADAQTNLSINGFISRAHDRFREVAIARAAEKDEIKSSGPDSLERDTLSISHNVSLFTSDLLSIEFLFVDYYAMAFHPNMHTRTLNFQLHPSTQLELRDLFKPSCNYLKFLSDFCIHDLHRQQPLRWHDPKQRAEQLNVAQDKWILTGAAPGDDNYERFLLAKGGMHIFFDAYQVGSYAEGRYDVFIPANVFTPVLKESIAVFLR